MDGVFNNNQIIEDFLDIIENKDLESLLRQNTAIESKNITNKRNSTHMLDIDNYEPKLKKPKETILKTCTTISSIRRNYERDKEFVIFENILANEKNINHLITQKQNSIALEQFVNSATSLTRHTWNSIRRHNLRHKKCSFQYISVDNDLYLLSGMIHSNGTLIKYNSYPDFNCITKEKMNPMSLSDDDPIYAIRGIRIKPQIDYPVNERIAKYLLHTRRRDGYIDSTWANYAASLAPGINKSFSQYTTYQQFYLFVKDNMVKLSMYEIKHSSGLNFTESCRLNEYLLDLDNNLPNLNNYEAKSDSEYVIKNLLRDVINATAIGEIQDDLYQFDLDAGFKLLMEMNSQAATLDCLKDYCRLGCICSSLERKYAKRKHCNFSQCVLNCVCKLKKPRTKQKCKPRRFKELDYVINDVKIVLNKLPPLVNCEVWCMTHNLYRCFCNGLFLEGTSYDYSVTRRKNNAKWETFTVPPPSDRSTNFNIKMANKTYVPRIKNIQEDHQKQSALNEHLGSTDANVNPLPTKLNDTKIEVLTNRIIGLVKHDVKYVSHLDVSSNKDSVLMSWNTLLQQYAEKSLYIWLSRTNVYITLNPTCNIFPCVNLMHAKRSEMIESPEFIAFLKDQKRLQERYVVLKRLEEAWLLTLFTEFQPDIKSRWLMVHVSNDIERFQIGAYTLMMLDLINADKKCKRLSQIVCSVDNSNQFGVYILPTLSQKIFIGPYSYNEDMNVSVTYVSRPRTNQDDPSYAYWLDSDHGPMNNLLHAIKIGYFKEYDHFTYSRITKIFSPLTQSFQKIPKIQLTIAILKKIKLPSD